MERDFDMHALDMYCEELVDWRRIREEELQQQLTVEDLVDELTK